MLWPAISTEPAIEDINHQWRSGGCSKECTARIHVQATSEDDEQKHKQTENQSCAVDPWAETTRTVTKYRSMKLR